MDEELFTQTQRFIRSSNKQSSFTDSSLLLPSDKNIQKCIADILESNEDDDFAFATKAKVTKEYCSSEGSKWKQLWEKRAQRLKAFKKKLAETK